MSGVSFLAVKTFGPSGRHRRRCDKHHHKALELPPAFNQCQVQSDIVTCWESAPPITPPADFLPPGYKKGDRFHGEKFFWEFMSIQIFQIFEVVNFEEFGQNIQIF